MDSFPKSQIVEFNRTNIISIEQALTEYQSLLEGHQAFKDSQFDITFMDISSGQRLHLQLTDTANATLALQALNLTPDAGYDSDDVVSEQSSLYISEVLLFAIALEHDALKSQLRRTAQAMVDYARYENDTSEMWVDDMRVFGAEALYMMAIKDADDAVYLAQFFIPYWDDEHANGYEDMLLSLIKRHGWCDAMMKAFVWCDNAAFRFAFYGCNWEEPSPEYQPLGVYLQQNPQHYQRFIELIKQRFTAQPMLAYSESDDLNSQSPVLAIYKSLFPEFCGWEQEEEIELQLGRHFIHGTLENEAMDLQRQLKNELDEPLMSYAQSVFKKREDERLDEARQEALEAEQGGIRMLTDFIATLDNNEALLKYVIVNENPSVLDTLKPFDIWAHCKAHAPTLYFAMDNACWDTDGLDNLRENIHRVFAYPANDLLAEEDSFVDVEFEHGTLSKAFVVAGENSISHVQSAHIMLRLLDIFYRLLAQQTLSAELCEMLTGEGDYQAIMTTEAYYARFDPAPSTPKGELSKHDKRKLEQLIGCFSDLDDPITRTMLEEADNLFRQRICCDTSQWDEDDLGTDALKAYLLLKDTNNQINDTYTAELQAGLSEVFERALALLLERAHIQGQGHSKENGFNNTELEQVKNFFTEDDAELSQQAIIALFDKHLHRDEVCRQSDLYFPKISEKQIGYHFFSDHDDDYQRVALICFWLKQVAIPEAKIAERLWQLLITMAPTKMIRHISRLYSHHNYKLEFGNQLDEINFYEMLNRHGIAQDYTLAFEVEQSIDSQFRKKEYLALVELMGSNIPSSHEQSSMIGATHKRQAQALLRGLDYTYQTHKLEFHQDVALRFPQLPFALDYDFRQCLHQFIALNNQSWETVIAHQFSSSTLFFGFMSDPDDLPKKLRLPLRMHPEADISQTRHRDGMSWIGVTIAQRVGDELLLLVGDKDIAGREQLHVRGEVLVLDSNVDASVVIDAVHKLPSQTGRQHLIEETLWSYLQGDTRYEVMAPLFNAYMLEATIVDLDEYRTYSLGQFLWRIDTQRSERLLLLLANHSYRAYKVIMELLVEGDMDKRVQDGNIDLETRLNLAHDDYEEHAYNKLMDWLMSHDVKRELIVLFAIKNYRNCMGEHLAALARKGELKSILPYLHVNNRAALVDILAKQADAATLLEIFKSDKSRQVRDRIESATRSMTNA
ncbi:hypothetical protein CXF83_01755 [Shewanella sp. Choline-02u-19]|uniref:hypothetical protein n=1 Tax=unclassified Shewanella TaxID=196818 RepID=UPI000C339777|nr:MULTISPECIES: hypothetical protein [unclassified Shewanella]PKH53956.1 hypothetical protein CXF84_20920 [Shewanella sp. Bg11-22]PKI30469.1 hypothetical protein CXF83_01755 [Shewanella sp. Choline-02u-19]